MKRRLLVLTGVLALASAGVVGAQSVEAQIPSRIVVNEAAPVFVRPDARMTPLRVAKEGSALNAIATDGEWYQVEFQDPQFGRRVGYIEKRHVSVSPVDLSIAELPVPAPQPATMVARQRVNGVQSAPKVQPAPRPAVTEGEFSATPERGWIDVNLGMATAAQKALPTASHYRMFGEIATGGANYNFSRGAEFDFGGGAMFNNILGAGISFSGTAHSDPTALAISIPHPLYYGRSASDTTMTEGEQMRTEGAVHLQVMVKAPIENDRVRVRFFGGPTYFRLQGDAISEIYYDQAANIFGGNAVAITGYESENVESTAWGYHAGADAGVFFNRVVGLGGFMRFSRGTVTIDESWYADDAVQVTVGGLQMGGGLRLRF